jgi:hypothetical protein
MRVFTASLAEMWSSAHRLTRLSPDEAAAEQLLARRGLDPEAPASQRTLELVLTAAAGPATQRELAGEAAAVTAFLGALAEPEKPRRQRSPRRAPVLAIAVAFIALVALCGTAEAGALPAPLQRLAHQTIGAPAPSPAIRAPLPNTDITPGLGGTGSHTAPASHSLNQQSPTPSASPSPTHTANGQGPTSNNGNGQATATHTPNPGNSGGNGKGKGKGNGNG